MPSVFHHRPKWFSWLPLLAALILALGILFGLSLRSGDITLLRIGASEEVSANAHGVGTVEEILRYIEAKYVDDLDRQKLVDGAVNNLLAELDPHSSYITAEQLAGHRAQLEGSATGLGIDVLMIRDSVTVVSALPGGPAALAGLQAYDRILSIGDSLVSGQSLTTSQIENWLGSFGEESIAVKVFRPGAGALLPINLKRTKMTVPSVAPGVLLEGDVAYIKLRQFGNETYEEFMGELERLVDVEKAEHLIIDLRGNSGGYLNEAVQLLSQLFPQEGQLLVYTEGAHSPRKDYNSTGRVFFPVNQVAVIIDQGSASASEIVAGAIKDWDRGVIVGQRSFGKGLVQELYPLKDGGALHITVSRYFTPSGRSIQRDYEKLGAYVESVGDSLSRKTDNVFATAGGRRVYGGGGIAPDVEVEVTSRLFEAGAKTLRSYLDSYVFERNERAATTIDKEQLLADFKAYATSNGLTLSAADWVYYEEDIRRAIANQITSQSGSGTAVVQRDRFAREVASDPFVIAALQAVRRPQAQLLK